MQVRLNLLLRQTLQLLGNDLVSTSRECDVVIYSVASVCLSVCLCLSCSGSYFDGLDQERSFLVCKYIIEISDQVRIYQGYQATVKVQKQKAHLCVVFGGGVLSIERQSCLSRIFCFHSIAFFQFLLCDASTTRVLLSVCHDCLQRKSVYNSSFL